MSESIVVKLKKGNNTFEVLAKPGTVEKYRNDQLGIDKVYLIDNVYKNTKKGDMWTNQELENAFGTTNIKTIIEDILRNGEYQMTAAERKAKTEQKRRQILNHIQKYYIDPKTNKSHPLTRIENTVESLKIRIDMDQSVEKQVQDIVKKMMGVIPLRKSVMEGVLKIPNQHAGKVMGIVSKWSTIQRQNWKTDGCEISISVIPGDYDIMMKELNDKTQGEVEFFTHGELKSASDSNTNTDDKKNKKNKKGKGKYKK